jgi:hypothetical protein
VAALTREEAMPEIVTCPDCQRTLRVPDNLLGKKVKCPGCQGMFTAAGGNGGGAGGVVRSDEVPPPLPRRREPEEDDRRERRRDDHVEERSARRRDDVEDRRERRRDDDYDDRPERRRDDDYDDYDDRRSRRRDDYDDDYRRPVNPREGWKKVALGLYLNVIGGWVWVGGMVLLLLICGLGMIVGMAAGHGAFVGRGNIGRAAGFGILMLLGLGLVGLAMFAELVLRVTGLGFMMAVPVRRGSNLKVLAIIAFALGGVEALCRLSGSVMHMTVAMDPVGPFGPMGPLMGNPYFAFGGGLFALASLILFLIFARGAALAAREKALSATFLSLLITYAVLYFLTALGALGMCIGAGVSIAGGMSSGSPESALAGGAAVAIVGMVIMGLLFAAYVAVEIWLILTMGQLRDSVRRCKEPA